MFSVFLATLDVDSLNAVFTLYTITAWPAAYFVITLTVLPSYLGIPVSGIFHRPLPFTITAQIDTGLTHTVHMHARTHVDRYCRDIDGVSLQPDHTSRRLVSRPLQGVDMNVLRRRLTGATVGGGPRQGTSAPLQAYTI